MPSHSGIRINDRRPGHTVTPDECPSLGGHLKSGQRWAGQTRPKGRALKAGYLVARTCRRASGASISVCAEMMAEAVQESAIISLAGGWGDSKNSPLFCAPSTASSPSGLVIIPDRESIDHARRSR
jgi:hypothetical protein